MRKTVILFSIPLLVGITTIAQVGASANANLRVGTLGKMKIGAFKSMNAQGAAMVKAIKPTRTPLAESDNALLMQVAMGGQKQLTISQAVLGKTKNSRVKLLAKSEVEEQTTVSAKLRQIAMVKGITLPTGVDAAVKGLVSQAASLSGSELDAFYLEQGGIKGHQELEATMTTVNQTAKDAALKALATATLPVIRLHLKVSTDVQTLMNK